MTMLITTKRSNNEGSRHWAGGEQPVQAKGEEVNLLVSAQIKMLLNANEARGETRRGWD